MKNGYIIKIVPPWGYRVFRVEFTPRHLAFALSLSALSFLGVGSYYVFSLEHAAVKVDQLRNLTDDQRERLKRIDAQASELDQNLRALQKQNDQIRKLIGADGKNGAKTVEKVRAERTGDDRQTMRATGDFATVAGRVEQLHNDSLRLRGEGASLRGLALHVLNMRRLEDIARARLLAAIPSI
ncbi:MAG: hypothetical protein GIW95_10540, partial [Candidatus Eremiobacteraeota bacterium]|nr:hypothetical protein [Candidatus Eremiobacteraeota bacterium]